MDTQNTVGFTKLPDEHRQTLLDQLTNPQPMDPDICDDLFADIFDDDDTDDGDAD